MGLALKGLKLAQRRIQNPEEHLINKTEFFLRKWLRVEHLGSEYVSVATLKSSPVIEFVI